MIQGQMGALELISWQTNLALLDKEMYHKILSTSSV